MVDLVICPGYWSPPRLVHGMAALIRDGRTWMSMTPMEMESQEIGIRLVHGHVAIFGLGMGWSAAASALRPEVTSVTIVERDADVMAMHRRLDIFAQLPEDARGRIEIEQGVAFAWTSSRPVDVLMPDIWLPLVSDGRVDEVRRMQATCRPARSILGPGDGDRPARRRGGARLDDEGILATVAAFDLPVIGPAFPNNAALLAGSARRWMKGRWLPGTVPPF